MSQVNGGVGDRSTATNEGRGEGVNADHAEDDDELSELDDNDSNDLSEID